MQRMFFARSLRVIPAALLVGPAGARAAGEPAVERVDYLMFAQGALGVGEVRPIASNDDGNGRAMSRRVEVVCK
jgi:hypothetical protein